MNHKSLHDIIKRNIPLGFLLVNTEGVIVDFNEAAERITGYLRLEAIGRQHCQLFHCDGEHVCCPLLQTPWRQLQHISESELFIDRKNGERILIAATVFPLKDESGNFLGSAQLFRDVTRRAQMERDRKNLLAMFAHDIKNPAVSSILLISGLLAERYGPLTGRQSQCLLAAKKNIERIAEFTENFLIFSQVDAKRYVPEKSEYDVAAALRRHLDVMRPEAENKDIRLHFSMDPENDTWCIQADGAMIDRVICNLMSNALKFTPSGGEVDIGLRANDGGVEIFVSDTGIGIAEEEHPAVFEPFYRGHQEMQGSGLGLAIARNIIEAHSGTIGVESILGKGSTFRLILPR